MLLRELPIFLYSRNPYQSLEVLEWTVLLTILIQLPKQ